MSSYTVGSERGESNVGLKLFALFAGVTIPAVMLIGLWLAISAFDARHDAQKAEASASRAVSTTLPAMPGTASTGAAGAVASPS